MHQTFVITSVRDENGRTRTLIFDRPLPAQSGQFAMVWLPGVDEKPFSIAAADPLALTVVAVGPLSQALCDLVVGDRVWVRGPLGQGFRLPQAPSARRVLLVGGGYGVAPLHFLACEAITVGLDVEVCIGARTAADVLLADAFSRKGAAVWITTEDGSLGMQGLVTAAVDAAIHEQPPDLVCACGPLAMLEAVERQCVAHKLPHQLSWEAHMRCGLGLCGSCELQGRDPDGWLTCLDGPVSVGPSA